MVPPDTTELMILLSSIPAVNGKVCPEYEKRGIQTATCDDQTMSRETGESEAAFTARVSSAFKRPGAVVSVWLE